MLPDPQGRPTTKKLRKQRDRHGIEMRILACKRTGLLGEDWFVSPLIARWFPYLASHDALATNQSSDSASTIVLTWKD
jgi:hypothetical protein